MSEVTSPKVITIEYSMKDLNGTELKTSKSDGPLTYLEGVGQIFPILETALRGLVSGDKKTVFVKAVDGFGEIDPEMVVEVPRAQIPKKDVVVGDRFHADSGQGHSQVVVVKKVTNDTVTVDGNQEFAGQDVNFEIEITEVREPTKEEVAHGHAHGPGGHHHH